MYFIAGAYFIGDYFIGNRIFDMLSYLGANLSRARGLVKGFFNDIFVDLGGKIDLDSKRREALLKGGELDFAYLRYILAREGIEDDHLVNSPEKFGSKRVAEGAFYPVFSLF